MPSSSESPGPQINRIIDEMHKPENKFKTSPKLYEGLPKLENHDTVDDVVPSQSILAVADRLVSYDRQAVYGHPMDDFSTTAELLNALGFARMTREGELRNLDALDIPVVMRMVKESRLSNDPTHEDSMIDIAGYTKTQKMVVERMEQNEENTN